MPKIKKLDKASHQCVDLLNATEQRRKIGRSAVREKKISQKIRSVVELSSSDENEKNHLSDDDNEDSELEDDFVPHSSSDEAEEVEKPSSLPKKQKTKKSKSKSSSSSEKKNLNLSSVDSSILNLKHTIDEIKKNQIPVYELLDDLDVESITEKMSAQEFQNNTIAIKILNDINSKKQSIRNPLKDPSVKENDLLYTHFKSLESALQSIDCNFQNTSASSSELGLSEITESLIDSTNRSIEFIGSQTISEIPKIPFRSREMEEEFMREPYDYERSCISGDKCEGLFINSSHLVDGFILVEYPKEEDLQYFNIHKKWPETTPSLCVLCSRKQMNDDWVQFLSGNFYRNNQNITRYIGSITYHNKVGPGEYAVSDVFTCDQNNLNASVVPIVLHSRSRYQRETRIINYGTPSEMAIKAYKQILTDPTSFRAGRTVERSTSSMSIQH